MKPSASKINEARKILGLADRASLKEIKEAFWSQTRKWHPDKCKKKDKNICHEKMKEINKAYKVIMSYVENYNYSFNDETVWEDNPEERWKKRFGRDPIWGEGWE